MPSNRLYAAIAELPSALPLFPLPGALLLPRGQMPLNIFEPRYVAMIDHALATDRLIGMIQPEPGREQARDLGSSSTLYGVGCAGRITQFAETGDGRYLIQLTGICRFTLDEEIPSITPFRQARVRYDGFTNDLLPRLGEEAVNRESLLATLRAFSEAKEVPVDWSSVGEAPNEALVNALSMMAPYGVREKQALLEAPDLRTRAEMLIALTEIELARENTEDGPMMQ